MAWGQLDTLAIVSNQSGTHCFASLSQFKQAEARQGRDEMQEREVEPPKGGGSIFVKLSQRVNPVGMESLAAYQGLWAGHGI